MSIFKVKFVLSNASFLKTYDKGIFDLKLPILGEEPTLHKDSGIVIIALYGLSFNFTIASTFFEVSNTTL